MKVDYEANPKHYGGVFLSRNESPDVYKLSMHLVGARGVFYALSFISAVSDVDGLEHFLNAAHTQNTPLLFNEIKPPV
jgi:hypothetical protein